MKFYVLTIYMFIIGVAVYNGGSASAKSREKVKVAMAQIFCLDGDRSGNLGRIENAMAEAKSKNADIVVFPETCLLGWVNPEAHQRAFPIPGESSDLLCKLAVKYDLFVCIGLCEKEGDRLYDSAILIDNQGNILLKHRKINILTNLMTPPYTPGNGISVAKTKFGNIGVLICADSFQETLLNEMKAKNPDLLLIPYGWANQEDRWPKHGEKLAEVVKNTSRKVGCPVVGTDLVGEISHGPWTGQIYGGASVAFDNTTGILTIGKDRERDIVMVTFEPER